MRCGFRSLNNAPLYASPFTFRMYSSAGIMGVSGTHTMIGSPKQVNIGPTDTLSSFASCRALHDVQPRFASAITRK